MIEVELEEPVSKKLHSYEILDDALYIITKSSVMALQAQTKASNNLKPKTVVKSAEAQA